MEFDGLIVLQFDIVDELPTIKVTKFIEKQVICYLNPVLLKRDIACTHVLSTVHHHKINK